MNIFKTIIAEIKDMENKSMIYLLVLSIVLFFVDIAHLFLHFQFPEWARQTYFFGYILSSTYFINKISKKERLERERIEAEERQARDQKEKEERERLDYWCKIGNYLNFVRPALDSLNELDKMTLMQFIQNKHTAVALNTKLINPVESINRINSILSPLELSITILKTYPHTVVQIDKIYYDVLQLYFSEGLK